VCYVTIETSIKPVMFVHCLDVSIMKFEEQTSGLNIFKPKFNTSVIAYSHCTLVTTLGENSKVFTK